MDPTTQGSLRDGFLTDCKRIHREWDTRAKSLDTDGLISLYAQDAILETPLEQLIHTVPRHRMPISSFWILLFEEDVTIFLQ